MAWDLHSLLPQLLSHHPPEEYHRCVNVLGHPVCRRCLALYPATIGVILLQETSQRFSPEAASWLMGLALPAALDLTLEQLGKRRYHPGRVITFSFLLAFPLGYGLWRYFKDHLDPWFWTLVLLYGLPTTGAVLWSKLRTWKRES